VCYRLGLGAYRATHSSQLSRCNIMDNGVVGVVLDRPQAVEFVAFVE
jgi:hypothetical protein